MSRAIVWTTRRKGKKGIRYLVRWIEPHTGINRGKTFRRLEDARACEVKIRRELKADEYIAPVNIGYDEWVKLHLKMLVTSPDIDVAPKTISGHKEALKELGEACHPKSPKSITPRMIREFRRIQLEKGFARRTINKHISAIRSALSYAVREDILPINKLLGPHRLMLREERKPLRILEVGEVVGLFKEAKDLRHKAAISLAYYHGLRRGEVCHLMWHDVDFEQRKLQVVDRPVLHTKTRLGRLIALREETSYLLGELYQQRVNEYVFEKPGTFYWSFDKWFPRLVKEAKLEPCKFHDLRKTCNTLMKEKGVSIEAAMQILGHSTMAVNQQYYTGILTEQQRFAINSIPSIG